MSTTLWQVEIASLEDCELVADLERAHEDAGPFVDDPVFALRLLYEQATGFDDAMALAATGSLGEAVTEDQIYGDDWMRAHADQYVARVRLEAPQGDPDAVGAVARYALTVTSPRWLEHLAPGQRWRSTAYS